MAVFLRNIQLWEIASKRVVAALKGHVGAVRFLDISPDGRHLVTCSYDYSIRIWSLRDGSSKSLLSTPGYYFISAKFSPNGRYVVASNLDRILRIWDVRSSQLIGRWDGNKESIWSLVFSPDEELLVTGCWDGVVKSWDISSLKEPARSSLSVLTEERMLVQKIEKLDFDGHWVSLVCTLMSRLSHFFMKHRETCVLFPSRLTVNGSSLLRLTNSYVYGTCTLQNSSVH